MGIKEKAILNEAAQIEEIGVVSSLMEYRYKKNAAVGYGNCSDDQYIAKIKPVRNIRVEMVKGYMALLTSKLNNKNEGE